jgi:hypothetical protein
MTDGDPTKLTIDDWIADLEISEAELAAGDIVSGDEIAADVQAALTRLEAKERLFQCADSLQKRYSASHNPQYRKSVD